MVLHFVVFQMKSKFCRKFLTFFCFQIGDVDYEAADGEEEEEDDILEEEDEGTT